LPGPEQLPLGQAIVIGRFNIVWSDGTVFAGSFKIRQTATPGLVKMVDMITPRGISPLATRERPPTRAM
jgi:hypothetical protein